MNRIIKPLFAAGSLVVSMSAADAQGVFNELATRIADANNTSEITTLQFDASKAEVLGSVAPEDPEIEFGYLWPQTRGERNRWSAGISQRLPDFRRRQAAGKVAGAIDSLKNCEVAAVHAENLFAARTRLIEYVTARNYHGLIHRIHENYDSLLSKYDRAWHNGEVTLLDLNKIKIEHTRTYCENLEADGQMNSIIRDIEQQSKGTVTADDLKNLTDYPAWYVPDGRQAATVSGEKCGHDQWNCVADGCDFVMPDLSDLKDAYRRSPQYRLAEARAKTSAAKVELASKTRFPQFSIGYEHAYEDGTHFNGLSLGMTLPVYSRKQEKQVALLEARAQQLTEEQTQIDTYSQIEADYVKASALKQQMDMLGPVIVSTDNLRLLRMALDGGEMSLLTYLQEINYYIDVTKSYFEIEKEYMLLMAGLMKYSELPALCN